MHAGHDGWAGLGEGLLMACSLESCYASAALFVDVVRMGLKLLVLTQMVSTRASLVLSLMKKQATPNQHGVGCPAE